MEHKTETNLINVTFNPTIEELREIEAWLSEEELRTGKGFYCNWAVIERAYNKKRIAILKQNDKSVGFAVWYENVHTAEIEIAEIKPGLRRKGLGKFLVDSLAESLLSRNIYVVKVHCQPSNSEKAWKKMGFIQYPDVKTMKGFSTKYGKYLYKVLIPTMPLSLTRENLPGEWIKLWAEERYRMNDTLPEWIWQLEFQPGLRKLSKPIIHPAFNSWRIVWETNNNSRVDDEVKYFPIKIDYGNFIIITEIL